LHLALTWVTFPTVLEVVRGSSGLLQKFPWAFLQQAINSPESSYARQRAVSSMMYSRKTPGPGSKLFTWLNKPINRSACELAIGPTPGLHHWTISASPGCHHQMAVGSSDGRVRLFDSRNGNEIAVLACKHACDVQAVRWSPLGILIVSVAPAKYDFADIFVSSALTFELIYQFQLMGYVSDVRYLNYSLITHKTVIIFKFTNYYHFLIAGVLMGKTSLLF